MALRSSSAAQRARFAIATKHAISMNRILTCARLAASEARGAERAHELEIHFGTLESRNSGTGPFDARHG